MDEKLRYILKFFLIVFAYYACTRLGLLFVIPPGRASVIWPAAGVALAVVTVFGYRYTPAVFVGALLNSFSFYEVIDGPAVVISSVIAVGAAMQAAIGKYLIQSSLKRSIAFENVSDVSKIMFFGGPVACCVSAFVASATLYYVGAVEQGDFVAHAYSWWIGDVFGVLVFAPLIVLILSAQKAGAERSLKKKLLVALPVFLAFSVFALLFLGAKTEFEMRSHQQYQSQAAALTKDFKKEITVDLRNLRAIESFFNASEYVSADEFQNFTNKLLLTAHGINGVSWLPKVTQAERTEFERSIQSQGFLEFQILRRCEAGTMQRSEARPVYFPLAYTQPYEINRRAHGFDVYGVDGISGNARKEALDSARDTGKSRATGRFLIVQQEDQYGFIIYHPVYETSEVYSSVGERRAKHIGYVNGIFVFPRLMSALKERAKNLGFDVVLFDDLAMPEKRVLYDSRTQDFKESELQSYNFDEKTTFVTEVPVAGRLWKVNFISHKSLLSNDYIQGLWFLVTGGVLFNSLLGLLLMVITARAEIVERLVAQKTHDLQQVNAELEEFAYRTSHDLRSPLLSSIGLLQVVEELMKDKDYERVLKSVGLVSNSLTKLEALVQDILALTHTKGASEKVQDTDIDALVDEALGKFDHMENFDRLTFHRDTHFTGPVKALKSRVTLVIENLISNAIKYQDPDEKDPYIKILIYKQGKTVIFEIEDNGLGIPVQKQEKLFEMFQRFHPKVSFGSGLGLYMMKKSADVLGAQIIFEDTEDGSRFKFILPAE